MASIDFTDSIGAATLENGLDAPFDRFAGWTPDSDEIGDQVFGLGTGAAHAWRFRSDYWARFRLEYVPADVLEIAQRLKRHLWGGGTCTVNTGDGAGRTYTAIQRPGGEQVSIELTDREAFEYTVTLELKNAAAAPMICIY